MWRKVGRVVQIESWWLESVSIAVAIMCCRNLEIRFLDEIPGTVRDKWRFLIQKLPLETYEVRGQ